MSKLKIALNTIALVVICLACNSLAHAQATRTWVSGVGDDVNPCSRTAPCAGYPHRRNRLDNCANDAHLTAHNLPPLAPD